MATLNFQEIKEKDLLLYEYIRGSQCYGLATETSDIDTGGVFMTPIKNLIDLGLNYQQEVASSKHDDVWFELNKFFKLLLTSNPTVLESLFIPSDCILFEHPIMTEIKKYKDMFVSKKCFKPFGAYAISQIEKCRGLNKKIVNPVNERLTPLDFCYTFYLQGSTKINNWLEHRHLQAKYCGLVSIPNMHDVYGLYYDWSIFFTENNITLDMLINAYRDKNDELHNLSSFIVDFYSLRSEDNGGEYVGETFSNLQKWFETQRPIGYRGILNEDLTSNELRLSSVSKGEKPICYMTYNQTGYTKHCIDYKNYKKWEKERNPIRYESNLNKNYDAKNVSHAFRLMAMCTEIANGEGINIRRTYDKEFLLDVKHHKYEYEEIIEKLNEKKVLMDEAIKNSTIREDIDVSFVNELLFNIRKEQFYKEIKK